MSDEEIIGLVVEYALTISDTLSNWIVDFGATCHMGKEEDLFIDIKELEKPQKLTIGDGFSVEAIWRETVELFMNISNNEAQRCQLFDILYVP